MLIRYGNDDLQIESVESVAFLFLGSITEVGRHTKSSGPLVCTHICNITDKDQLL